MCLMIITPEQAARMTAEKLEKALVQLAEAQRAVAEALRDARHTEDGFRSGRYTEKDRFADVNTTVTGGVGEFHGDDIDA